MEHHTRSGAALLAVCGAGLLAAVAQPANAGVVEMTFESLAHADNGLALHGSQYQENGFRDPAPKRSGPIRKVLADSHGSATVVCTTQ